MSPGVGAPCHRRGFLSAVAGLGLAALLGPTGRWGLAPAVAAADPAMPAGPGPETARAWRAMGTLIEVRVPDLPGEDAVEAIRRVRRRVEATEAALTLFREESPLVAFNRTRAGTWLEDVPAELLGAVEAAVRGFRDSRGAYDPTVGPVLREWGLQDLAGRAADPRHLAAWRHRAGPEAVEVHVANRRLRRLDPAVEIDLGGIGKGIAVDGALEELAAAGSRSALVNLGGSIGVLGPPPDRSQGWPVGIARPDEAGEVWMTMDLARGHLATSGDYERWVNTPSGRRHHIIDPRSGDSAPGVASVTVWAEDGSGADVASTATFVQIARGQVPDDGSFLAILRGPHGLEERRQGRLVSF